MIRALALLLLVAPSALAQRSACGFGDGLAALRDADRALAAAPRLETLSAGRDAADAVAAMLRQAGAVLQGCGCPRAAADAADAARMAEQAQAEASLSRIRAALDRARLSLGLARSRLDRTGCG